MSSVRTRTDVNSVGSGRGAGKSSSAEVLFLCPPSEHPAATHGYDASLAPLPAFQQSLFRRLRSTLHYYFQIATSFQRSIDIVWRTRAIPFAGN